MIQNRCVPVCRAEQERHRSVSKADTPPKCSDLFDQSLRLFLISVLYSNASLSPKTNRACEMKVFLMFWWLVVRQWNESKACVITFPSHEPSNKWINDSMKPVKQVMQLCASGCPGTHLTEDSEGFGQSFAQQADPFGKQLVQMFPEMLADKEQSWF